MKYTAKNHMKYKTKEEALEAIAKENKFFGLMKPNEYHSLKPHLNNSISKSLLAEFSECPYKFKYNLDNGIQKFSAGFRIGSLVDCLALTPDLFDELYLCEPLEIETKKDGTLYANGQQSKAQKIRWQELKNQGIEVIDEHILNEAKLINENVQKFFIEYGIQDSYDTQKVMILNNGQITMTGMIDILPHDENKPIIDLKTTSCDIANERELMRTIVNYKYHWQASIYCALHEALTSQKRGFAFLFVESKAPYRVRLVELSSEFITSSFGEWYELALRYIKCVKKDDFGTPLLSTLTFEKPSWI